MSVFVVVTTFYTLECVLSFFFLRCCTSDDNISPPLSGEVARRNAETERSYQICDNLSVTFGDSSPERGAFGRGGAGPQYVVGDITSTTQDGEEGAERVGKSAESIKIGCIF